MSISAAMVKELRERTGAGMMECKKALVAADGDVDLAMENLRKSGAAKAAKKAGRVAAEGVVVTADTGDGKVTIAEINSETDFVAKDEHFLAFAGDVAATALEQAPADVAALAECAASGGGGTVEQRRLELVQKVGENITVRRFERIEAAADATLGVYLHGGRIGVVVEIVGADADLARDIAMHVAAANPSAVSEADLAPEVLEKEREIQIAQAEQSGKPREIIEKMVTGRLKKFVGEITLLGQPFVKDPDQTVGKLLDGAGAKVTRFVRFEVGEGIEKEADNFADEVMAQAQAAQQSN